MWEDSESEQVNMGGNCVLAREFPNVGGRGVREVYMGGIPSWEGIVS